MRNGQIAMIPHQPGIASRAEPTISYPFVKALCHAVGEDSDIVETGLRRFELSGVAADVTRVSLSRYIGLFEWLAVELDRPYLGLELSQQTGPEMLGAISYMFLGSRNLETAINNFSSYVLTVQDNSRMYLDVDGEYAFLDYGVLDRRITHRRHDSEYSIGFLWRLLQIFSANAIRLTMVEFEHDRPIEGDGPFRRFFGAPVLFGRRANRLHLRAEALKTPSRSSDPHLFPILEAHMHDLAARVEGIETFSEQVRSQLTLTALANGLRTKAIATRLGISESTLHRRLGREGTSFKNLRDEASKELVTFLISQENLPIATIARRLGYAETACLTRAFHRWFGMSPRAFRNSLHD